jgi:hypothetical protein
MEINITSNNNSNINKFNQNLVPKERRPRKVDTVGQLDNLQFFRTPNGSFWDDDGEYFNRHGFDVHGGHYSKEIEYIPGPDWLSDLGCYPDEKEKYENNLNNLNDEELYQDDVEEEFKGDFEEDYDNFEDQIPDMDIANKLDLLNLKDDKMIEKYLADSGLNINEMLQSKPNIKSTKSKKSKNNKNSKKNKNKDEEGWETVEEDENI